MLEALHGHIVRALELRARVFIKGDQVYLETVTVGFYALEESLGRVL